MPPIIVCRSLEELSTQLLNEKKVSTRFPVRFILIENINAWEKTIKLLGNLCSRIIRLSTFCSNEDALPKVSDLYNLLKEDKVNDILVYSLSDALRIVSVDEQIILKKLIIMEGSGAIDKEKKTRIYIPLYQAQYMFDKQMVSVDRFLKAGESALCYKLQENTNEISPYLIHFFSPDFAEIQKTVKFSIGIKGWLQTVEQSPNIEYKVCTKFAQSFMQIQNHFFRLHLSVFDEILSSFKDINNLSKQWGNDYQWNWLYKRINNETEFDSALKTIFNCRTFDALELLSKWKDYSKEFRWLLWLWLKIKNISGFLGTVLDACETVDDFENQIVICILNMSEISLTSANLKERRVLLDYFGITNFPEIFWDKWNTLSPIMRLKTLTDRTLREKIEIVRTIKVLMEESIVEETWINILSDIYPCLAWYLAPVDYGNELANRYFENYKKAKIQNIIPETLYNTQLEHHNLIYQYRSRQDILNAIPDEPQCFAIDALGAEWLAFICNYIQNKRFEDIQIIANIGVAALPTISEYNKIIFKGKGINCVSDYDDIVHDRDLQHPDYIVKMIDTVTRLLDNILSYYDQSGDVIFTADHGSSRLAVIQDDKGFPVPDGGNPERCGRICKKPKNNCQCIEDWADESEYWVVKGYGRFQTQGRSICEIHGGATLEETLVPIIRLTNRPKSKSIIVNVRNTNLLLDMHNKAVLRVSITPEIPSCYIKIGLKEIPGIKVEDDWFFSLENINEGEYPVTIVHENQILKLIKINCQKSSGIIEDDLGL